MKIIPAIDIINGSCVRLTKGDYSTKKVYHEDPLEVAKEFEDYGIKFLHVVDLDGAKSDGIVNYKVLEKLATKTNLSIDFGGGIKKDDDLRIAFECGANQVTVGSIAAKNPDLFLQWLTQYGAEKIILGADVNNLKIATDGWQKDSKKDIFEFLEYYVEHGVRTVICTDISKDGMLQGPAFELYNEILNQNKLNLIASGGISSLDDLDQLAEIGCSGAILGKAIYEGTISLADLSKRFYA